MKFRKGAMQIYVDDFKCFDVSRDIDVDNNDDDDDGDYPLGSHKLF